MSVEASTTERHVVQLLATVVALLSVLVVALAVGGAVLVRHYVAFRHAVGTAVAERDGSLRDVLEEVTRRQQAAAAQLVSNGKEDARQVAEFERRAAALRNAGSGPIDGAKKAIGVAELMLDESTFALKQTTAFHDVLAKVVRPLPAQREALEAAEAADDSRAIAR